MSFINTITVGNTTYDLGVGIWSETVSCSAGATTATFTDDNYENSWIYDVYTENLLGNPVVVSSIVVNNNQVVVTFNEELSVATNVKLHYWTVI